MTSTYPGPLLRRAREARGLTVRDVATALGVGHGTVARWETGTRQAPVKEWPRWAAAVGASVEIVVREEAEPPLDAERQGVADELRSALPHLNSARLEVLLGMVRSWVPEGGK
jgi:transcriptional regulator with XRE-family HTH domain